MARRALAAKWPRLSSTPLPCAHWRGAPPSPRLTLDTARARTTPDSDSAAASGPRPILHEARAQSTEIQTGFYIRKRCTLSAIEPKRSRPWQGDEANDHEGPLVRVRVAAHSRCGLDGGVAGKNLGLDAALICAAADAEEALLSPCRVPAALVHSRHRQFAAIVLVGHQGFLRRGRGWPRYVA